MTDNHSEWSEDRLKRRLDELRQTQSIAHNEYRWAEIEREISHIKFEMRSRQMDTQ
jgi:hypothetical protein